MGKYIKYFKNSSTYENTSLYRPSVSYIEEDEKVFYDDFSARLMFDNSFKQLNDENFDPSLYVYKCEDSKKNVIEGYKEMSYLEVSTLIEENTLLKKVKRIGIYDANTNERYGEVDCSRVQKIQKVKLYSFGVLSDVHNQTNQSSENERDLQNALEYFNNNEDVEFTCICGDLTLDGTISEFTRYKNNVALKSPDTPVYACAGNHDAQNDGLDDTIWKEYTNCEKNYVITKDDDIFIFFSMAKYSLGRDGHPYSDEGIEWLKNQLNMYKNKRVFIFTHLFFPDMAGHFKERYNNDNSLLGEEFKKLRELRRHFKNVIWFSGHSHWKWYLQQYQSNANIDRDGGWTVHIPSCAYPIDSVSYDGGITWSRDTMPLESEGAIIDVYKDYIEVRAMDLKNNILLPMSCYRLDTKLINIEEDFNEFTSLDYPNMDNVRYINSNDITINLEKNESEFIEFSDIEDNYIKIKYLKTSTGLLVINADEYTKWDSNHVKLLVEDVKVSYDDINYTNEIPHRVGFFKKDDGYTLESCEDEVYLKSSGQVQLNVSSTSTSTMPLYVKIKFKLAYK